MKLKLALFLFFLAALLAPPGAKAATACPGLCIDFACNQSYVARTQCRSLVLGSVTACWEWDEPCYLFPSIAFDEGDGNDLLAQHESQSQHAKTPRPGHCQPSPLANPVDLPKSEEALEIETTRVVSIPERS